MAISVKNYTNRYIAVVILVVIAVWAALFYAFMMDEVYDNIDDGLKNQKIEIIRAVYKDSTLLETRDFGVNQFKITPASGRDNVDKNNFSKEYIFMPYDGEDEPYRVLRTGFFDINGAPYHLEIRTSTVEEDDYLINLAISLGVLYVLIVCSVLVINYFVLSRAWKPFAQILHNMQEYRFGEVKRFVPTKTNVKEFLELGSNFESMILRNEKAFDDQKRFLENASHELQTPLASAINKMELLLSDDSLNEKQFLRIAEAKQSLHRMVSLNKALLMLSRIDNDQYLDVSEVSFNAITLQLLDDLKEIIDFKNLEVTYEVIADFVVSANTNLITILLSNVLRNAIKYNIDGGKIQILLDENEIHIQNSSYSDALNPAYIFERFYKGKQDNQSNGLGLSIVKSIINQYPFLKLSYNYKNDMHIFSILSSSKF